MAPPEARGYENRANLYATLHQYAMAIRDYDRSIELDSRNPRAFINRAIAYDRAGHHAFAAADHAKAIHLDPTNAEALNGRCYVLIEQGDPQQALGFCNRALAVAHDDAEIWDTRGLANLQLGRYADAIRDHSTALRSNPRLASSL